MSKEKTDITRTNLRINIASLWMKGFRNLEIVVPSQKEIKQIKSLFEDVGRKYMKSVFTGEIAFDGLPIIIDETVSRWFVRRKNG